MFKDEERTQVLINPVAYETYLKGNDLIAALSWEIPFVSSHFDAVIRKK